MRNFSLVLGWQLNTTIVRLKRENPQDLATNRCENHRSKRDKYIFMDFLIVGARRKQSSKKREFSSARVQTRGNRNALLRESSGHVRSLPVDCRSLTPLCWWTWTHSGYTRYAIHALDTACGCPGWTEKNTGNIVSRVCRCHLSVAG